MRYATALAIVIGTCLCMAPVPVLRAEDAAPKEFTNSAGMKLVCVQAGSFLMGQAEGGDFDERPVHKVTLTRPFYVAATEVTNAQFEQFDPGHKELRGKRGFSKADDEAVIFVNWHEAAAFCQWLSKKEGKPYRLPTEAEWEYACRVEDPSKTRRGGPRRAGTTTAFSTGDKLPAEYLKNQSLAWEPKPVSLTVGKTPPNAWGLYDMHGNVEEWCADWYGPYEAADQTDPVGRASGDMKVTRGGSHNTPVEYLRSANRLGTLPEDKHWLIGFRVVMGEAPQAPPLPAPAPPFWARDVRQERCEWPAPPDAAKPHFAGPRKYVSIPAGSNGPLFAKHNHCPSITVCPNGDLLAAWFSTNTEEGREMAIAASRLRRGTSTWEPASLFFKAPDRNMTGTALWWDGKDTLYHFNGLEAAGTWGNLALVLRTSTDNGATWQARFIDPEHRPHNQVISGTIRTREGFLLQACDAVSGGNGGTAIHVSPDGGRTWSDPSAGMPRPDFKAGASGGTIAGIHAGVVQLLDGRLMAFGRGDAIDLHMPMSLSADRGKSWTYAAGPFTPISSGQRLVLMRLREGPLLFCSFTDASNDKNPKGMTITDAAGRQRTVYGLFAVVSEDDGKTWSQSRLISDDGAGRKLNGGAWTSNFVMDASHAEPRGYLAATQAPDGRIHLISSALHYEFNLAWLKAPMPPEPAEKAQP